MPEVASSRTGTACASLGSQQHHVVLGPRRNTMTADEEIISFGMDRPPRPTSRLMIGVAATCLVLGFLAGLRTEDALEKQDDEGDGTGERTAQNEPSIVPEQGRPQKEEALRIGEPFYQFHRRTTTAAQFRDPIPLGKEHRPAARTRFVGLMIETCAHADMDPANAFSVSALDWELLDADGRRRQPLLTDSGSSFSRPTYPASNVAVHPGDCVRGWVVWALPKDFSATTAVFTATPTWWAPEGDAATAKWKLA